MKKVNPNQCGQLKGSHLRVVGLTPEELPGFHPVISVIQTYSPLPTRARCNQLVWKWGEPIRDEVRLGPSPFPETTHCASVLVFPYSLSIYHSKRQHTFATIIYWVKINLLRFPRTSDLQSLHLPEASANELFPASFLSTWGFRERVILSVFVISPGVSATELLPVSPYFLRISATELSPCLLYTSPSPRD